MTVHNQPLLVLLAGLLLAARIVNVPMFAAARDPVGACITDDECAATLRSRQPAGGGGGGIDVCQCYAASSASPFDECEGDATCPTVMCVVWDGCAGYGARCVLPRETSDGTKVCVLEKDVVLSTDQANADPDVCPDGEDSVPDTFCGRGPNRADCGSDEYCFVDPADRFAVCCPGSGATGGVDQEGDGSDCTVGAEAKTCTDGSFCQFRTGTSCNDSSGVIGRCTAISDVCSKEFDPVCGCNDQTYSNACMAHAAGVNVASKGECESMGIQDAAAATESQEKLGSDPPTEAVGSSATEPTKSSSPNPVELAAEYAAEPKPSDGFDPDPMEPADTSDPGPTEPTDESDPDPMDPMPSSAHTSKRTTSSLCAGVFLAFKLGLVW